LAKECAWTLIAYEQFSTGLYLKTRRRYNSSMDLQIFLSTLSRVIPNMKASELAKLFVKEIYQLHGLPEVTISNHISRFTGEFCYSILRILVIKEKLSMVFHLEIDGQTEKVNQILKQFLRILMVKKD
jgi:hypothetical protein